MSIYVIKKPVITEKSLKLANEQNTYVFEVDRSANKSLIKQVIEDQFGVNVLAVNTVMRAKSKKRAGKKRTTVAIAKTKKALVKLKKGETIDLFDIGGNK